MSSVAHNILHVPSWGAISCVVENLQVCLLICFITQPFQRNSIGFCPWCNHLRRILTQYLVLMRLLLFPLVLVRGFVNLHWTAPR